MFLKNVGQVYKNVRMREYPDEIKNRVALWKFHDSGEARSSYVRYWEQYKLPSGRIVEFIWHQHDGYGERAGQVDLIIGLLVAGEYQ